MRLAGKRGHPSGGGEEEGLQRVTDRCKLKGKSPFETTQVFQIYKVPFIKRVSI